MMEQQSYPEKEKHANLASAGARFARFSAFDILTLVFFSFSMVASILLPFQDNWRRNIRKNVQK
jgi:hypothetical protein